MGTTNWNLLELPEVAVSMASQQKWCGSHVESPTMILVSVLKMTSSVSLSFEFFQCASAQTVAEDGLMAALHCSLRSAHRDAFAGARSHMYGTSASEQWTESWWSCFGKQRFLSRIHSSLIIYFTSHFWIYCIWLCWWRQCSLLLGCFFYVESIQFLLKILNVFYIINYLQHNGPQFSRILQEEGDIFP